MSGTVATSDNIFRIDWLGSPTAIAIYIAIGTVLTLIYGRYEIRLRRLRMIRDYIKAFPTTAKTPENFGLNPSLEFVRTKYSADVGPDEDTTDESPEGVIKQINATIKATRLFFNPGDIRILIGSLTYAIVVFAGFRLVLMDLGCTANLQDCPAGSWFTLFTIGGLPHPGEAAAVAALKWSAQNTATIAALVFVGAYVSSLRYLAKALSVFDLSAYTFIRQTVMIVVAVLVTIVLYRALPNPLIAIAELAKTGATQLPAANPGIPLLWMLLALAFGLLPESALQFVLVKTSSIITWIKTTDDRFIDWTRVVPLDAIDGIDYFTRFRLEECGIGDVQALASYNPIMLHIETPYGIYQAVDWIAQAQLCCVVGLDRFLLFRQFNIRTIFDLERALNQDRSLSPADRQAINKFDRIYAGILFAPNSPVRGIQKISETRFLIDKNGGIEEVDAAEYSIWARNLINGDADQGSRAIEHIMDWIGDDLHVRRLRRLWNEISVRLGPTSIDLLTNAQIGEQSRKQ